MSQQTLKQIWAEYASLTSDKDTKHSYIDVYETLLAPYRDGPTRMLEIGVGWGDSLIGWSHYFADGDVVGLDYYPHATERVGSLRIEHGDSRSEAHRDRLFPGETFEVIIDDGDHDVEAQMATFRAYRHLLRPKGIYIVEDVQSPVSASRLAALGMEIMDLRSIKGRDDDILAIYKQGDK